MRRVFDTAALVAPQDTNVLITGETGVGKERLARWIHEHSRRANHRLVAVNCGALPETLLDSHLFGYARGAFTGAVQDVPGVFEVADGTTLFLDEIGDVTPAMQVKLLRVLQEREVQRMGEWRMRPFDVRVIAATNRDLSDDVAQGRFRKDLFYRLNVVQLQIPPLRERQDDLLILSRHLLTQIAGRLHRHVREFTDEATACLLQHDWPGNVRELENAIEAACTIATGTQIRAQDLPPTVRHQNAALTAPETNHYDADDPLTRVEQAVIDAVLRRCRGNRRKAAAQLHMSLSTLKRKIRRHRNALKEHP